MSASSHITWHDSVGPLPVMVGYNGSQSSDAYSVAHQMDFLTQEVFNPARRKQQHDLLFMSLH